MLDDSTAQAIVRQRVSHELEYSHGSLSSMETTGFWHLGHVSDDGLRRQLQQLCASGCRTEARIVAHLAEVERRRLHLKDGFSSLQKYCLRKLGLSENVAFYRMTAARIAQRYPIVFEMLEQGKIHLAGLCTLRDFLTNENHRELLDAAAGKTKARVLEELARRFPRAKIADSIRRLPKQRVAPAIAPASTTAPASKPAVVSSATPTPATTPAASTGRQPPLRATDDRAGGGENSAALESEDLAQSAGTPPRLADERVDVMDPETGEVTSVMCSKAKREQDAGGPARRAGNAAMDEIRYRVQFDASSALKAKIELAKALSSHANPKGDLETLFERALDLFVEFLQKKRFAKTEEPRQPSATEAERAGRVVLRSRPTRQRTAADAPRTRAHIPNATRREVVERDGLRCAYVSETGQRCDEQAFLQLHHQRAWARNGGENSENLSIFCAGHNRLMAELDFGAEHVAQRIEESRSQ